MSISILDSAGSPVTIPSPNVNGRAAAVDSGPVALSTEDKASLDLISGKLPSALGPQTGAASLSVVPASDGVFSTVANSYAKVVPSNTITRPANTTAYIAGQIVGVTGGGVSGRFAIPSLSRINGGAVRVDRVRLYKSQATASGIFVLRLYRGDPAAVGVADQVSASSILPVGNASAAVRLVGRFIFDMTGAVLGTDGAERAGIPTTGQAVLVTTGSAETTLYGVLTTETSYTPISGETFSVVIEGYSF
jgi:hypothetical protein